MYGMNNILDLPAMSSDIHWNKNFFQFHGTSRSSTIYVYLPHVSPPDKGYCLQQIFFGQVLLFSIV